MGVVGYAQRFADTLRRFYYVTPKNYLDLIANYRSQLKSNDKKIEQSVKRLDGGTSVSDSNRRGQTCTPA